MEKSFLYISDVSCGFWYGLIWNSLRYSSHYFQDEAFLFCSVLGLVLAFILVGVHSSLSLGLPCPLQNFVGAAIDLLLARFGFPSWDFCSRVLWVRLQLLRFLLLFFLICCCCHRSPACKIRFSKLGFLFSRAVSPASVVEIPVAVFPYFLPGVVVRSGSAVTEPFSVVLRFAVQLSKSTAPCKVQFSPCVTVHVWSGVGWSACVGSRLGLNSVFSCPATCGLHSFHVVAGVFTAQAFGVANRNMIPASKLASEAGFVLFEWPD
jgi:hypothetical protein